MTENPKKTPNSKPSRYFDAIVLSVATGSTIKASAEAVGCSLDMAYQMSRTPEFRQRVNEIRAEALQAAVGILSEAAIKAARTLEKLLDDPDPKIQIAAAAKLFSAMPSLTETHDLRKDIEELREALKPRLAAI